MKRSDSLPPPPPPCIDEPYPSSQKGGTVVDAAVTDLAEHARRLADPDGYRPARCLTCDCQRLHVHDYPRRKPRADPDAVEVKIVRYACVDCGARWRVLPRFLARHLWRTWRVVEWSTFDRRPSSAPVVPPRTIERWCARLGSAARVLVQVLATSGAKALETIAQAVGLDACRHDVVLEHAHGTSSAPLRWLANVAEAVHRLSPGVRVM